MLYIEYKDRYNTVWEFEWHIGEKMPEISERVVTFQADGDELNVILAALNQSAKDGELDRLAKEIAKMEKEEAELFGY